MAVAGASARRFAVIGYFHASGLLSPPEGAPSEITAIWRVSAVLFGLGAIFLVWDLIVVVREQLGVEALRSGLEEFAAPPIAKYIAPPNAPRHDARKIWEPGDAETPAGCDGSGGMGIVGD